MISNIHFLIITFVTHPCSDSWELILNGTSAHIHKKVSDCEILTNHQLIWPRVDSDVHSKVSQNPKIIAELWAISSEMSKRNSLIMEDQILRILFPCLLISHRVELSPRIFLHTLSGVLNLLTLQHHVTIYKVRAWEPCNQVTKQNCKKNLSHNVLSKFLSFLLGWMHGHPWPHAICGSQVGHIFSFFQLGHTDFDSFLPFTLSESSSGCLSRSVSLSVFVSLSACLSLSHMCMYVHMCMCICLRKGDLNDLRFLISFNCFRILFLHIMFWANPSLIPQFFSLSSALLSLPNFMCILIF